MSDDVTAAELEIWIGKLTGWLDDPWSAPAKPTHRDDMEPAMSKYSRELAGTRDARLLARAALELRLRGRPVCTELTNVDLLPVGSELLFRVLLEDDRASDDLRHTLLYVLRAAGFGADERFRLALDRAAARHPSTTLLAEAAHGQPAWVVVNLKRSMPEPDASRLWYLVQVSQSEEVLQAIVEAGDAYVDALIAELRRLEADGRFRATVDRVLPVLRANVVVAAKLRGVRVVS